MGAVNPTLQVGFLGPEPEVKQAEGTEQMEEGWLSRDAVGTKQIKGVCSDRKYTDYQPEECIVVVNVPTVNKNKRNNYKGSQI